MRMFDWLGLRKGLPLWWSYKLNAEMKEDGRGYFRRYCGYEDERTEGMDGGILGSYRSPS